MSLARAAQVHQVANHFRVATDLSKLLLISSSLRLFLFPPALPKRTPGHYSGPPICCGRWKSSAPCSCYLGRVGAFWSALFVRLPFFLGPIAFEGLLRGWVRGSLFGVDIQVVLLHCFSAWGRGHVFFYVKLSLDKHDKNIISAKHPYESDWQIQPEVWASGGRGHVSFTVVLPWELLIVLVRVIFIAGYGVKIHACGDRVCSVVLWGNRHGCLRVITIYYEMGTLIILFLVILNYLVRAKVKYA